MGIDLYRINGSPPCDAVQLLAKTLGIELNLIQLDFGKEEQLKPEYLKINPQHTVPTINDNGFYLWESKAIMLYFIEKYAKDDSLYPKCPTKRAVINRMLYYDTATLYQRYLDIVEHIITGVETDIAEYKKTRLREALGQLNVFLKDGYAAGDTITVADYSIMAAMAAVEASRMDLSPYPNIVSWMKKCKESMPGYHDIVNSEECGEWFLPIFDKYGLSI